MTTMENLLQVLKVGTTEEIAKALADYFNEFGQVNKGNQDRLTSTSCSAQVVDALFRLIRDPSKAHLFPSALQVLRIFTRNPTIADTLFNADRLETLLHLALLVGEEEAFLTENSQAFDARTVVEALKCISNLVSTSRTVRRICCTNACIDGILLRLRMHPDPKLPNEVKQFDMTTLFLLSSLCPDVRSKIKEQHGLIYLMEALDLILKNNAEYLAESMPNRSKRRSKGSRRGRKSLNGNETEEAKDVKDNKIDDTLVSYCLDDWEVDLANVLIKVIFNMTLEYDNRNMDECEEAHCFRLVSILHDLLLCDTKNEASKTLLQQNIVNLLTCMPPKSYEELLSKISELGKPENPEHEYEEMNVEVISVLLKYFDTLVSDSSVQDWSNRMIPVLMSLSRAAKHQPIIRKYLRYQILPPLREVNQRPEEGNTLRNKLVRLMTSPDNRLAQMVGGFLLVLCKENRARLIKYTGYGNAAGFFAQQGLVLTAQYGNGVYSSDSDESDTEEYIQNAERIDPVIGCVQPQRPNAFENMTEEQREYEANRLVNIIDQLQRQGLIQPCKIGEDGVPKPVEHVLELQETGTSSKNLEQNSDSD